MEVLGFLLSQSDKVMIGFFRNAHDLGVYSMAASLIAFVPVVLQAINQIFSPIISDLHSAGQTATLGCLFQTLAKWTFAFTFPGACALIVFAPWLMGLFGAEFQAGWPILVVGTIGQLINCAVGSVGYMLLMSGHEQKLLRVQLGMACFITLANCLLIPRWGILGAAVAAAMTNALTNLWCLYAVRKQLTLIHFTRSYARMMVPAAISTAAMVVLQQLTTGTRFRLPIMAAGLISGYAVFLLIAALWGLDDYDRLITSAIGARLRGARRLRLEGI